MNNQITHLVVNGCSFTYCQGLDKPYLNGWPALLGQKLNLPVVNLAMGGNGNDAIYRKTLEYFFKNKVFNSNPLYIIALSHSSRREEYLRKYRGEDVNDYVGLDLGPDNADYVLKNSTVNENIDHYEFAHLLNLDYITLEKRKMHYWVSLINHFKVNNIPYVIGDYMPLHDKPMRKWIKKDNPFLHQYIYNDKHYVGDFSDIVYSHDKLPCGHDGYESQKILSEKLYKDILSLYPNLVNVEDKGQFLTLKDFYNKQQKEKFRYNEWLQHDLLTE